jgi:predicted ArsR family transcriptional regulator
MTNTVTLQEQARALGDPTRHAIYRHVADTGTPVGVAELTDKFGLNHNAIRQHLAKLVAAGLVIESTTPASGRGRPRLAYELNPAAEGQWGTMSPYERLSQLLLQIITTGRAPEEVGRANAQLFSVPSPSGDVVADVSAAMARQGFQPEVKATRDGAEIILQNCPFASAALTDRATVCAVHLGIAEGLTTAPATVTELVAYDPRKASCRLRIQVSPHDAADHNGQLTLRNVRPSTSTPKAAGGKPRAKRRPSPAA